MGILNLYSKRRKQERGEGPDVYQYTDIPNALRVQIIHIWESSFGNDSIYATHRAEMFKRIEKDLCREYGLFRLGKESVPHFESVANFLLQTDNVEQVLDVIELTFKTIDKAVRSKTGEIFPDQRPDEAIHELNSRFREHGVGFQYEAGQLVRVDSQIVHSSVVKPALQFLSEKALAGANQEFLSAHEHYRNGKSKECLNDCLKAFESTLKAICDKRKWTLKPTDTARSLLDVVFQKELIPSFMQSHFTALRATLEAGVPTVRNKLGGHGQGVTPVDVPDYVAAYALHLTATNILFLAQADKEFK